MGATDVLSRKQGVIVGDDVLNVSVCYFKSRSLSLWLILFPEYSCSNMLGSMNLPFLLSYVYSNELDKTICERS